MNNTPVTVEEILAFVANLSELHNSGLRAAYPACEVNWETLEAKPGKRFVKVVSRRPGSTGGSAFAFIDIATGDIYKPAGWSTPAKGARGNIRKGDASNLWCGAFTRYAGLFVAYAK